MRTLRYEREQAGSSPARGTKFGRVWCKGFIINTIPAMKKCTKCSEEKPLSEFSLVHPRKGGRLRSDCKLCRRKYHRAYYAERPGLHSARVKRAKDKAIPAAKQFVADYLKTHGCVDCPEVDPVVLEFDHVRGTKVCDVSNLVKTGARLWRIECEIGKCEVRCANCHRRRHHRERADVVSAAARKSATL